MPVSAAVSNSAGLIQQNVEHTTAPFSAYWEGGMSLPPHAIVVVVKAIPGSDVRVRQPFFVFIEMDGDQYYVTSPISLVYEVGDTKKDALRNYLDVLADHFEWLVEEEDTLAPTVQEELTLLRRYLYA